MNYLSTILSTSRGLLGLVVCFAWWLSLNPSCNAWGPPSTSHHKHQPLSQMPHYTSMQSHDDVRNVEPILRTLYDPPPRIDDVNQINATITAESAYVTHVTNGTLQTEDGSPHVLYYEVHHRIPLDGHRPKRGLTGLVLHGGPGAGCFPRHANFFSPELYEYVVLFDQRGCGRSTPLGDVSMNTLGRMKRCR